MKHAPHLELSLLTLSRAIREYRAHTQQDIAFPHTSQHFSTIDALETAPVWCDAMWSVSMLENMYCSATEQMKMGKDAVEMTHEHEPATRHLDDALVVHPHITLYYNFIELYHHRTHLLSHLYACIPLTRLYASQAESMGMDLPRTLLDHSGIILSSGMAELGACVVAECRSGTQDMFKVMSACAMPSCMYVMRRCHTNMAVSCVTHVWYIHI